MKIIFHGAAGGVTGSKHVLEVAGKRILLDCGMYQGRRKESDRLNRQLPFDAHSIDAVLLSHAHIDHSGLLPLLVKNGYTKKIYCTPATKDILTPMLMDAAHIQESDAAYFLKKKHLRDNAIYPIQPLYTSLDAELTLNLLVAQKQQETFEIFPGIEVTFYNAGHVLGSVQMIIEAEGKKLAFTGDYGRSGRKILKDPVPLPEADVIISESTYGGRLHPPVPQNKDKLAEVIIKTAKKGGKLIIPSFALERTQELLYDLHVLFDEHRIPEMPVFVDSPLATKFTRIFEKNKESFDEETREYFIGKGKNPFSFERLHHTETADESKALNTRIGPFIIISGSGMCEGGRIRHHLRNSLGDPKNTILFVGYQAVDTLGRKLVEKHSEVQIFNETYHVSAEIEVINGYSGHGDQKDLIENITRTEGISRIFLVHGEPSQQEIMAAKLREEDRPWEVIMPKPGEEYVV